eukprot:TRINITY_DN6574_c0_g1_i1.p1 TRINITY_DN6574_c0_g1~~TRINITY_DN6574_c0_g1_i1.p1  ORF type:complete len:760 (-),score=201.02 TRINITY_DN6574_c0_g1_i1:91-2370(-)
MNKDDEEKKLKICCTNCKSEIVVEKNDSSSFDYIQPSEIECNYTENEKIGGGKYGTVYRGKLRGSNIALKTVLSVKEILETNHIKQPTLSTIKKAETLIESQLQYLAKEQEICKSFYNPHILTYLGATSNPSKKLVLVSELLETDLNEFIKKYPDRYPPSLYDRMMMCYHVCCGLAWLFDKVIHFDLKPSNILIKGRDNNKWGKHSILKIGDFGLSIFVGEEEATSHGTPMYSSPESIQKLHTTSKTDVWSFGWIFANILTWKSETELFDVFFHGKFENQNAARKALMDFITNKSKIRSYIEKKAKHGNNETIMSVILGCLTVDPNNRPTFLEIVDVFNQKIFLQAAFQNSESGKNFWSKYFVDQGKVRHEVSCKEFLNAVIDDHLCNKKNEPNFKFLKKEQLYFLEHLFTRGKNKNIQLSYFASICGFFGPIDEWPLFISDLKKLVSVPCFYFDVKSEECEKALYNENQINSFLVRCSSAPDSPDFVIVANTLTNNKMNLTSIKIQHLFDHQTNKNVFVFQKNNYASLLDIINTISDTLHLKPLNIRGLRPGLNYLVEIEKSYENYKSYMDLNENFSNRAPSTLSLYIKRDKNFFFLGGKENFNQLLTKEKMKNLGELLKFLEKIRLKKSSFSLNMKKYDLLVKYSKTKYERIPEKSDFVPKERLGFQDNFKENFFRCVSIAIFGNDELSTGIQKNIINYLLKSGNVKLGAIRSNDKLRCEDDDLTVQQFSYNFISKDRSDVWLIFGFLFAVSLPCSQ